jgi:hypothetical protein
MYVLSETYFLNVALRLLQGINSDPYDGHSATANYSFVDLGVTLRPGTSPASCIMNILLDAQGNAEVQVQGSRAAVNHAYLSSGNDHVDLNVDATSCTDTGLGNDTISIKATGESGGFYMCGHYVCVRDVVSGVIAGASSVSQGEDNDSISIDSRGSVFAVLGGAGTDTISITGKSDIFAVHGGIGSDVITITSDKMVQNVAGDGGSETENSEESLNDTISITAEKAMNIDGNGGDDTISITANSITWVTGGRGNDHITLNNTGNEAAFLYMNYGDGHDVIETNGALEIALYPSRIDWHYSTSRADEANVTRNGDNTLTISFPGTDNQITVKFTGAMAETGDIAIEANEAKHTLVIRAANGS